MLSTVRPAPRRREVGAHVASNQAVLFDCPIGDSYTESGRSRAVPEMKRLSTASVLDSGVVAVE